MAKVRSAASGERSSGDGVRKLRECGFEAALSESGAIGERERDAILAELSNPLCAGRAYKRLARSVKKRPAMFAPHAEALFSTVKERYIGRRDPSEMDAGHCAVLLADMATAFPDVARPHVAELVDNALPRGGSFGLLFRLFEAFPRETESSVIPVARTVCAQVCERLDQPTFQIGAAVLLNHLAAVFPAQREELVKTVLAETLMRFPAGAAALADEDRASRNRYEAWFDFASNFVSEPGDVTSIAARELVDTYLEYTPGTGSALIRGVLRSFGIHGPGNVTGEPDAANVRKTARNLLGYAALITEDGVAPHVDAICQSLLGGTSARKNPWLDKSSLQLVSALAIRFREASEPFLPRLLELLEPVRRDCAKSCPPFSAQKAVTVPKDLPSADVYATVLGAISHASPALTTDVNALLERALEDSETRDWAVHVLAYSTIHVARTWTMVPHILRSLEGANPSGRLVAILAIAAFLPSRAKAPPEFAPTLERAAGEVEAYTNELIGRPLTQPEAAAFVGNGRALEYLQLPPLIGKISISAALPFLVRHNLKEELAAIGAPFLPRDQLMAWTNLNGSAERERFAGLLPIVVNNPPVLREFNSLVRLKTGRDYWAMSGHSREVYTDEILESAANVMPTLRDILSAKLAEIKALKTETERETQARTRQEFIADVAAMEEQIRRTADVAIRAARGKRNAEAITAKQEGIKAEARAIAERGARDLAKEGERVLAQRLKLRLEDTAPIEDALGRIEAFLGSMEFVRPSGDSHRLLSRCKSELGTGAATADCTAPGGINSWSVPVYLMDFGYQSLFRYHTGRVFSRIDMVLATSGGKRVVIIDAIEAAPWSDTLPRAKRSAILAEEFARVTRIAQAMSANVYAGSISNRDWMTSFVKKSFPQREVSVEKFAGMELARQAIRKCAGVNILPQSYLQSFSQAGSVGAEEQEGMRVLEQAINARMDAIGGLREALLARDFDSAAALLKTDPVAWQSVGETRAVQEGKITELLTLLYTASPMSGTPRLAVVFEA